MNEIESLIKKIDDFRDERNWRQYHNAKDLAISLSIEASELLEAFQWKTSEEAWEENKENIKEEIADVLIYALTLCSELNIDVEKIVIDKIRKNGRKYKI
ncbi:nucleotide pyrophosphohydrolase [Exiguobacterium sp. Leaf196]|jgi:NTP pyrophosphatase (non-canonical NTP hydrolase)|uniref:nucleotide pyrophosphohydrolase n=1 Tax=Exiguobacterium sp. Leaf196 TaxID=1736298 RepID=UPI0006FD6D04|nr:nucleotide pyrophosphohydrolase [Exiguobacterium sp. Leaf196]KQS37699.1 nucleotide pyrophosphohydrolase [Exiguobacterium sp. Leaf196]